MAGTSWPALIAGAKARASDVENKFDWIEGNIVPMNGGSSTDAAYDLGTSDKRWRRGYFSTAVGIGLNTTPSSHFHANVGDASVLFDTNTSFTTTAVSIKAMVSSATSLIPLEIRASTIRITSGPLALPDTSTAVSEFSTDGTFAGDSDSAVPTEKAVKTYVASFLAPVVGTTSGAPTSQIGSSGQTLTTLSMSSSGERYEFFALVRLDAFSTMTSAVQSGIIEIQRPGDTIGSSLFPGGQEVVRVAGASTTAIQVGMHFFASVTSGAHTFFLTYSSSGLTATSYSVYIRKVSS